MITETEEAVSPTASFAKEMEDGITIRAITAVIPVMTIQMKY